MAGRTRDRPGDSAADCATSAGADGRQCAAHARHLYRRLHVALLAVTPVVAVWYRITGHVGRVQTADEDGTRQRVPLVDAWPRRAPRRPPARDHPVVHDPGNALRPVFKGRPPGRCRPTRPVGARSATIRAESAGRRASYPRRHQPPTAPRPGTIPRPSRGSRSSRRRCTPAASLCARSPGRRY
jgi:hypothetical protein